VNFPSTPSRYDSKNNAPNEVCKGTVFVTCSGLMETRFAQISVSGKSLKVPGMRIEDRTIVVTGKWIKMAAIHDENWQAGNVEHPESIIAKLKTQPTVADIFNFAQKLPDIKPRFNYPLEWENVAAIPITSFEEWWEKRLPQETRKNVRKAGRRGVVVRTVELNDVLVQGIKAIYDETPIRQGRRFWHYGKDLETIKRENSSYLDRCEFIGAFHQEELIGFIKMVYVGKVSNIMQIISKKSHYDKRPANALLAKAVEICGKKGMSYFVYGQYVYGNNNDGALTEFKRRNGFEQILFPRYYIPLTAKGRMCMSCRLHLGMRRLIPKGIESFLLRMRSRFYERRYLPRDNAKAGSTQSEEGLKDQQG